ncbi:transcriptional repressor [candidate division KSB1 bacterium]|nr:transcriptional repressor [candidate division KSB1 bacterium]
MNTYKNLLVECGIKPTYQRIRIMEYLDHNRIHPTADIVYHALCQAIPTLSRTTVYNTIERLKKYGLVEVLSITGSEIRYDYNTKQHQHFLCLKCGSIYDIHLECPIKGIQQAEGHKIKEFHCYFKGICKDCLQLGDEN